MTDTKRQEYDATPGLNYSTLKLMRVSPAYLRHMSDHPEEMGDKPAYVSGRAVHCAVLEPYQFGSRYTVMPKFSGRGMKAAKQEWLEWQDPDVEIISQEDHDMALRCRDAVYDSEAARDVIKSAQFEKTVTWEIAGIKCKGRLDILTTRVTDLKFTRRNTIEDVEYDFAKFDYHANLAWYHDGAASAGLISGKELPSIIAVHASQKSTFVDVAVMKMDSVAMHYGEINYRRLFDKYVACLEANWWPGMAESPAIWELPAWKQSKEEDNV